MRGGRGDRLDTALRAADGTLLVLPAAASRRRQEVLSGGWTMIAIDDEYMWAQLATLKEYSLVLLRPTAKRADPGATAIVWEHGRRNFELRASGVLAIVCPVTGPGELAGMGIFAASLDETRKIMDEDPAVKAGLFTYEMYLLRGFPGDRLP